ncbi:MAG: hypothetical protein F6J93_06180 [Oscillatoria sp. SIO1A7]|nr:hypothetical protein [Oscillatoria sp. SIO1A7]
MNSFPSSLDNLDNLTINTDSNPEGRRRLTREEILVFGWLARTLKGRTYSDMARDCKLTIEQCIKAVQGLLGLGLLRVR